MLPINDTLWASKRLLVIADRGVVCTDARRVLQCVHEGFFRSVFWGGFMRLGPKDSTKAFVRIKFEFLRRSKIVQLLFFVTVCGVLRSDGVLEIPTLAGIRVFAKVIIDFLKAILEFFVGQVVNSGVFLPCFVP